jgi:hypothetical protein
MVERKLSAITMITVTFACLALALTAFAAVNVTTSINSSGSIVASPNLGLYTDSACTVPLASLDWGALSAGGTISKTVYVKNIQGTASLTLGMATSNWNPTTANGPLAITWDKQGTILAPGQSTAATIKLAVSSSISGITTFGVQIVISGTG